jgi:hypothetical protein
VTKGKYLSGWPAMRKYTVWLLLAVLAARLDAEERRFDFSSAQINAPPPGCVNTLSGEGKPGDWRVLLDEVPLDADGFTGGAQTARKSVVGQVARDTTDNHFPMLVLGDGQYGDFSFTTKFKIVGGDAEQMAGVAFRMQDENNFYVVRANVLSGTFYFYKFEKGLRSPPIGNKVNFTTGVWHELTVECRGTEIQIKLDGTNAMPTLNDTTFTAGKIALWTKSDSVAYFTDARVTFVPKVPIAQQMVDDALKEYPRVLGLQVFVPASTPEGTRLIASADGKGLGEPGEAADADVIKRGVSYYRKDKREVRVTMPLVDRNGDWVAAVRVMLKPLPGQTEENARVRALPIIQTMQQRMAAVRSLTE